MKMCLLHTTNVNSDQNEQNNQKIKQLGNLAKDLYEDFEKLGKIVEQGTAQLQLIHVIRPTENRPSQRNVQN